jgi:hypothetical protein
VNLFDCTSEIIAINRNIKAAEERKKELQHRTAALILGDAELAEGVLGDADIAEAILAGREDKGRWKDEWHSAGLQIGSRSTIDKYALIEQGVDPAVIEKATKKTRFVMVDVRLRKQEKGGGAGEPE